MNIVYIGKSDALAGKVIETLGKEDNTVFLLGEEDFKRSKRPATKYKFFRVSDWNQGVQAHLKTIYPDMVIYTDPDYMNFKWVREHNSSVGLLTSVLENMVQLNTKKFIYFSTTDVYGKQTGELNEESRIFPVSKKGICMAQCEYTVELYCKRYNLDAKILRVAPIYSYDCVAGNKDFMGTMAKLAVEGAKDQDGAIYYQPVHVADVADAVKRVSAESGFGIYNVACSDSISKQELLELISGKVASANEENNGGAYISCQKIKKETEWIDFWQISNLLKDGKINIAPYEKKEKEVKRKANGKLTVFRKVAEILVLFAIFAGVYFLTLDHGLFGKINWLLIFVTLVPLFYGVRFGTMAVVISSIAFLTAQGGSLLEIENFYSYVDKILVIVEYIFFGIVVGYTVDMLREEITEKELEIETNKRAYDELNEINEKNVLIKKEYEKRILESKDSLPRIYAIISKINVLEEGRIFMEILQVVKDLLDTNTVAIYRSNGKSPYLRLLASLNEESLVGGRSWNISDEPEIVEAINKNEIYEGNVWEGKPAIVMPVGTSVGYSAIIVVRELSMEKMSLHTLNLMRTLFSLISTSIEKALQYDNVVRSQKYIEDTHILSAEEFRKALDIAAEKKEMSMSDYCVLRIVSDKNLLDTYQMVDKMFREVDVFGTDGKENLYILLDNTTPKDEEFVLNRLAGRGIEVEKKEEDTLWTVF